MLFRLHLKANQVPGWEEAYVRYSIIADAIEKGEKAFWSETRSRSVSGSKLPQSGPSPSGSHHLSIPLLEDAEDLTEEERRAVFSADFLREELDRLNDFFLRAVDEIERTVECILRDAPTLRRPSQVSRSEVASSAFAVLQSSKFEGMEQALRNLYKSCFVLMQVSSLNYVGLRKLIKKATKQLGKDACEKAGFVTRDELRFAPFFLERNSESSSLAHQFSSVVEAIEACYASHFADGDKERAKAVLRSLRHPPPKGPEVLLMGTLLGATAVLAAWAAWLLRLPDTPSKCPFCTQYLLDTLPAFRVLLVPVVWLWTWAISCRVWESCAINYIYILDCNQHSSIGSSTAMRLAGNASVFLLAAFVAYVGALRTGVYWLVSPLHYPLFLLFFGAFTLFGPPIGTGFSSSRLYFLRCLWRSALAPCFEVRFRDNFVADVMTSMVVILRDIAAMVFFYLDGGGDDMPGRNRSSTTAIARLVTGPLITALPYWWRLMQCLRRWHDTPHGHRMSLLHLVNAGKYFVSLTTITLAAVGCHKGCSHFYTDADKWTVGRICWFSCLCVGTVYSYLWDVLMDWSLLERCDKEGGVRRGWRLRSTRGYSARWFYPLAMFTNLLGRLMWTFTIEPEVSNDGFSPQVFTTIVALVEVLRRGQWALLRLENEHLSNASNFRSVLDVPLMVEITERRLGRHNRLEDGDQQRTLWQSCLALCTSFKSVGLALLTILLAAAAVFVIHLASNPPKGGL